MTRLLNRVLFLGFVAILMGWGADRGERARPDAVAQVQDRTSI